MDVSTVGASGPDVRSLVKEAQISAPPMEVWSAWTTNEGIASWWGPAAANVDLRIGGSFEILFTLDAPEGSRGSEGCKILAYVPGESLSFTWNAPPHLPLRETNTWVVLTFAPVAAGTSLRLVHTGFLTGPDWDDYLAYFDRAWSYVLDLLREHWS
ncbi:MAG: SRPBCC domain-containing protein [Acidimicrobiia bacterium]|nr:SRPBCC domain-containing protein [Acidimicrobiia bacterium]